MTLPEITLLTCKECPREFCGTSKHTHEHLSRHIKANHSTSCKCVSEGMLHGCSICRNEHKSHPSFNMDTEDFEGRKN